MALIFTFSSEKIDGSNHTDLKRMDRWAVARGSMGTDGVGR